MQKSTKKILAILFSAVLALGMFSACSASAPSAPATNSTSSSAESKSASEAAASGAKQDFVIIITAKDTEVATTIEQMTTEKFSEKYNVISKAWDTTTLEQTVKTAAAAGTQIDLVQYWPNQMNSFTSANLAMDLTPFMDDEWAAIFNKGVLELGTYNGKLVNVPYNSVYPMIIANKDITDAAGLTLSDQWTWDEFIAACKQIQEKTDAFGAAIYKDWACWLVRNGCMQAWDTDAELDAWNAGKVSFNEPKIKDAFEKVAAPFKENLFYPGDGSLAVTLDQATAAFGQGKFAFFFDVNTVATQTINDSGLENYQIIDWPAMGNNPTNPLLGGSDGYFIPTCAKNIDGAIEAMRYLTSKEILTLRAENGFVPTAEIDTTNLDQDYMTSISRCVSQIYPTEIINIDAELSQYLMYQMPANYIYNGSSSLDELETLRKAAVGE